MRRMLFVIAMLTTTGCATSAIHGTQIDNPASVVAQASATTAENTPPEGAEISDDPVVRFLNKAVNSADADVALQIATSTNDRALGQCIGWARLSGTQQAASELASVKQLLQVMPVHPVGPISAYAEARRVSRDIQSGAVALRLAQFRGKLMSLRDDFAINCGPLSGLLAGGL